MDSVQRALDEVRHATGSPLAVVLVPGETPGIYQPAYVSAADDAGLAQARAVLLRLLPGLGERALPIDVQHHPGLSSLLNGPDAQAISDLGAVLQSTALPASILDVGIKVSGISAAAIYRCPIPQKQPGFVALLRRRPVTHAELERWRASVRDIAALLAQPPARAAARTDARPLRPERLRLPHPYSYDRLRLYRADLQTQELQVVDQSPDEGGRGIVVPLSGAAVEAVVTSGRPLVRQDLTADRQYWSDDLLFEEGYRSAVYVPVQPDGGGPLVVELASRTPGCYTVGTGGLNGLLPAVEALLPNLRVSLAPALSPEADDLLDRMLRIFQRPFDQAFLEMMETLRGRVAWDAALVELLRSEREQVEIAAVAPSGSALFAVGERYLLHGTRMAAMAAATGPTTSPDLAVLRPYWTDALLYHQGHRSAAFLPLRLSGRVTGLWTVTRSQVRPFTATELADLDRLSEIVALAAAAGESATGAAAPTVDLRTIEALLDNLKDGIILVDAALRPVVMNRAARGFVEALGGGKAPNVRLDRTPLAPLLAAVQDGKSEAHQELEAPKAHLVLEARVTPLTGPSAAGELAITLHDVSSERLMRERLVQSEKMASVGQLVFGVAHELNNPLTGVIGFAQLLLARDLDDRARWEVQTIYSEAERAAKIVQNLLSFARRRRPQKESVNVNHLIERVIELRSYELRVNNIDVELDLDPVLPETMADPDQIQQVLFNIIANAEHAMLKAHGRGTLSIRTAADDAVVTVRISDDGPGIPKKDLLRVFDPFYTTKEVGEGTGLGLSICYGIIEEHGGRIWAESPSGSGATFIFELPLVSGARAARPADEPESAPSAVAAKRILVVDDEETIQDLLSGLLSLDGHVVEQASNGREALDRVRRQPFDVIITDIKMPELDGPAFYKAVKAQRPALANRIIFITGDTISPQTRGFIQQTGNPFLSKPFKLREVRETVQTVLDSAEGLGSRP
jgi:signal transduction histidine kinase/ActR/RegA family two-component response regulator